MKHSDYQQISDADDIEAGSGGINNSVLSAYCMPVCFIAWVHFIVYQSAIGYNRFYSAEPICPYSDQDFGKLYWYCCFSVLGGFVLIWLVLAFKIYLLPSSRRTPLILAINVVSMGTVATFLALVFHWGGVCIDVLNVASPAAIWGEWLSCGPLLIFITVSLVEKPSLSRIDVFLMVSFYVCLLAGFLIIPTKDQSLGMFWLILSCVTYLPLLYLPWIGNDVEIDRCDPNSEQKIAQLSERFAIQTNLSIWLTIVLPLYTVNYLIAYYGGINASTTIIIYQILSVLTKGLFVTIVLDLYLVAWMRTEQALVEERRINNARRTFMKYNLF